MNTITNSAFKREGSYFVNKIEIKNISEYQDYILFIKQKWAQPELWYRGVSNYKYKLVPSIYRNNIWSYNENNAYDIFNSFVRLGNKMSYNSNLNTKWEWYQLQQHYGLPTRLLDWTEGYLIALYFAVKRIDVENCPCVWVLDPFHLNKLSINLSKILYNDKILMDDDDKCISKYLIDTNDDLPLFPVALLPAHVDQRIKSQKSCFTVHGSYVDGFDQLYFNCRKKFRLFKLKISISEVKAIKEEIISAGISESSLFPDMEGLARELKYKYGMK